jgi:hypothetical protein
MTLHTQRAQRASLDKLIGRLDRVLERARKVSLSNPMMTACPELTAETAWFFATRGDDSLQPRKILSLLLVMALTSVRPYNPRKHLQRTAKPSKPCNIYGVHPYIRHPLPCTRLLWPVRGRCECVGCASIFGINEPILGGFAYA